MSTTCYLLVYLALPSPRRLVPGRVVIVPGVRGADILRNSCANWQVLAESICGNIK